MKVFILFIAVFCTLASSQLLGDTSTYLFTFKNEQCQQFALGYAAMDHHKFKFLKTVGVMITQLNAAELEFVTTQKAFDDECLQSLEKDQMVYLDDDVNFYEDDSNNDYYQWHLKRISQRNLPLTDVFERFEVVAQSHVYVIDSGIDGAHPELKENIGVENKAFTTDICCGGSMDGLCDCNKHGTHCAGLVNSKTAGYNLHTTLHSGKVFNWMGSASYATILEAMDWAGETHINNYPESPGIVSMSLGGGFSASVNAAVKALHDQGLTVIVAAGNSNKDACTGSPASSEYAITVAASDINDGRAYFSEYGNCVDIFAPGLQIYSTVPDGGFEYLSGTSMATPIVAGLASYLATVEKVNDPVEVKRVLQCVATEGIITDAKTANNLLSYHDYHEFNSKSCTYANDTYPELMKLLKEWV